MIEEKYIDLEIENRNNYIVSVGYKHWDSNDPYNHIIWLKELLIKKLMEIFGITTYVGKHSKEGGLP